MLLIVINSTVPINVFVVQSIILLQAQDYLQTFLSAHSYIILSLTFDLPKYTLINVIL